MFYPFIISNIKLAADKITIRINNIVLCFSLISLPLTILRRKVKLWVWDVWFSHHTPQKVLVELSKKPYNLNDCEHNHWNIGYWELSFFTHFLTSFVYFSFTADYYLYHKKSYLSRFFVVFIYFFLLKILDKVRFLMVQQFPV